MAIRELPPAEPVRLGRRVSPLWMGLVVVVALLAGAIGWMLRDLADGGPADHSAVAIGHVDDFPVGALVEVIVDAEFYDPYGVEAETSDEGGPGAKASRLLVIRQEGGQVVAMYASSRWLGCRVTPVDRAGAIDMFTTGVPDWFVAGMLDPCHGGLYAPTGEKIRGPGERGLDRFPVGYASDGTVLVDLTRPLRTGSLPPGAPPPDILTGGAVVS